MTDLTDIMASMARAFDVRTREQALAMDVTDLQKMRIDASAADFFVVTPYKMDPDKKLVRAADEHDLILWQVTKSARKGRRAIAIWGREARPRWV